MDLTVSGNLTVQGSSTFGANGYTSASGGALRVRVTGPNFTTLDWRATGKLYGG